MRTMVQRGETLSLLAPYDVASGAALLVGTLFGFASSAALSGEPVEVRTTGVFQIGKVAAEAWTVGQSVYWDDVAKKATAVAAGNVLIGAATEAATNPSSTGVVRIGHIGVSAALQGAVAAFDFTIAAGAANVAEITITPKDGAGAAMAGVRSLELWLSDAATGAGLTGTTASGTVTTKANEGAVLTALTAKKHIRMQTKAAGTAVLQITDTAKTGFYVCIADPATGAVHASRQLVAGDYGA